MVSIIYYSEIFVFMYTYCVISHTYLSLLWPSLKKFWKHWTRGTRRLQTLQKCSENVSLLWSENQKQIVACSILRQESKEHVFCTFPIKVGDNRVKIFGWMCLNKNIDWKMMVQKIMEFYNDSNRCEGNWI